MCFVFCVCLWTRFRLEILLWCVETWCFSDRKCRLVDTLRKRCFEFLSRFPNHWEQHGKNAKKLQPTLIYSFFTFYCLIGTRFQEMFTKLGVFRRILVTRLYYSQLFGCCSIDINRSGSKHSPINNSFFFFTKIRTSKVQPISGFGTTTLHRPSLEAVRNWCTFAQIRIFSRVPNAIENNTLRIVRPSPRISPDQEEFQKFFFFPLAIL